MPAIRVEIWGAVQGVGFRWFAREAARRLRLTGRVKNRSDGSVEIVVAGPDLQLQRFVEEMRAGPSGARVDAVRSEPADDVGMLDDPFTIRGW
ncbi:MAG: acylphosphatase [Gemmatimonadota bacterium]|nr:acylphosphatase [Gemmatimonadota bacterium]